MATSVAKYESKLLQMHFVWPATGGVGVNATHTATFHCVKIPTLDTEQLQHLNTV